MPRTLEDNTFACQYCGKTFPNVLLADSCEKGHNMILVPMTKEELASLIQFFYTKEDKLLKPDFIKRLTRYRRVKEPINDMSDL